jgi:hypothetical protein
LETLDRKVEVEGPSKFPRESPPPSPKEDQPQPPPTGEQSQPECKIELCTPDIVDLPIINLQDAGRPFKIKSRILEWHISLLKRRMEKMEIEKEAQHLKAAETRSTCKECEEYDHVQVKPRINASSSIQDLVPLCAQFKDLMDEQAEINKDVVTKFEAMEKILKNLDGKVMEVGSSICEVFIMMKMLEMQVEQLAGQPMGDTEEFLRQPQGSKTTKATQTNSGDMEDHTKETMKITTEGPEFVMPSHYMKKVVASVKTKRQSLPVKTKKMIKPKNKPVPKMVQKWVPKIATPAKSVDPK